MNPYIYGSDDPVTMWDPTGEITCDYQGNCRSNDRRKLTMIGPRSSEEFSSREYAAWRVQEAQTPLPPPVDPSLFETRIRELTPSLLLAGKAFDVPYDVLAGVYATEMAVDPRDALKTAFEIVGVRAICLNRFSGGACDNRSVGEGQLQIDNAMRVDTVVRDAYAELAEERDGDETPGIGQVVKALWDPNMAYVQERLRDDEVGAFYVAAYLDLLRSQHPPGTDWGTIYSTPTSVGEYNRNPIFRLQFEASMRYYRYP